MYLADPRAQAREDRTLTTTKTLVRLIPYQFLTALQEKTGCRDGNWSCYPLKWKTIYEFYEEAGVSWHIYQDHNNFDDNPLAWFEQFQKAQNDSPLKAKGMSYVGLDAFYRDAASGSLPEVSFIVGPQELSEHPPWMPKDGAWLQKQVVDAVTSSPKYSSTLLIISFDGQFVKSPKHNLN